MTNATGTVRRTRPTVAPRLLGPIRPRPRWLELRLLALVAVALAVGSLSLEATVHGKLGLYDPEGLFIYVIALFAAHAAQVLAGRRTDQILLPTIGLLGGISLLLMQRLPQDLVTQTFFGTKFGLAEVQLIATGEHHLILIVRGRTADWVLDNRRPTVMQLSATRNEYILYRVESTEDPKFWTKSLAHELQAQHADAQSAYARSGSRSVERKDLRPPDRTPRSSPAPATSD